MQNIELLDRISELEREIAMLPEGSITKKKVNGKDYYYHRVFQDGKRKENYIRQEDLSKLSSEIKKRKELEKEYKELKLQLSSNIYEEPSYNT